MTDVRHNADRAAGGWPEPVVAGQGLRRARLLDRLQSPAHLTLIPAPAGSG